MRVLLHTRLVNSSLALVTNSLQIIIYLHKKFFFLVDTVSSACWQFEYSHAVVCDILRLCTEYFTKGTAYCKVKRLYLSRNVWRKKINSGWPRFTCEMAVKI